jgi:uncharacterized membrane protein AbrB (regulator of aidB expression)
VLSPILLAFSWHVKGVAATDINNWVTNLQATVVDYALCGGCSVHKGFREAEQKVIGGIISAVKTLQSKYPSYQVVCTGHR